MVEVRWVAGPSGWSGSASWMNPRSASLIVPRLVADSTSNSTKAASYSVEASREPLRGPLGRR